MNCRDNTDDRKEQLSTKVEPWSEDTSGHQQINSNSIQTQLILLALSKLIKQNSPM